MGWVVARQAWGGEEVGHTGTGGCVRAVRSVGQPLRAEDLTPEAHQLALKTPIPLFPWKRAHTLLCHDYMSNYRPSPQDRTPTPTPSLQLPVGTVCGSVVSRGLGGYIDIHSFFNPKTKLSQLYECM